MARKKDLKPLLATKHDFVESLDNVVHQSIMLLQAIEMPLDRGMISEPVAELLRERITAFRAAIFTDG